MSKIFEYTKPNVPDDCKYIISPSQIYKFFDYPKIWYQENYLQQEQEFKGSTSTVIGTICHYIYEQYVKKNEITRDKISKELREYFSNNPNPDVNIEEVENIYPEVAKRVMNDYVIPSGKTLGNAILKTEVPVYAKVKDSVYIAGTVDRIEGTIVVDYKNVSTKPNESVIPFQYKIQLYSYAYTLRKLGYEIDRIRIVYGIRPTKTIGARCIIVTEQLDYQSDKLTKDTLELIADSILTVEKNPHLAYLIFKSMDLK